MSTLDRLGAALADRYRIERELGAGGMAVELAADSRGSANVAEATNDSNTAWTSRHFSDISRAVASATSMR